MALIAEKLNKTFSTGKVAAKDVTVRVAPGDFVAIVGESGSGKSTAVRMMLGLIEADSGSITWNGKSVNQMSRAEQKAFRSKVQMVFQDPSGALNPRKRIRKILSEVAEFYSVAKDKAALEALCVHMLDLVGLPAAHLDRFPHELSGGQRQRVLIARSMIPKPEIILADEAVSALDVSVKAGVLRLMENLRQEQGVGYLLISHDLPVVRKVAQYVYVMRAGEIVEEGPTESIFSAPQHDYTKQLLGAALDLDAVLDARAKEAQTQ